MNTWRCDYDWCTAKALGKGPAFGLRAIGWFYDPLAAGGRGVILCPIHHPQAIPCKNGNNQLCRECGAHAQAIEEQTKIAPLELAAHLARQKQNGHLPPATDATNDNGTGPAKEG